MVTIRNRDTMKQQRVLISELKNLIKEEVDIKNWLLKI
jgi:glycyl-tRNA synthetase